MVALMQDITKATIEEEVGIGQGGEVDSIPDLMLLHRKLYKLCL
jgi:hypothetical protein